MFLAENSLIMTLFIAGFIFALLLAAAVIVIFIYCMFYKERHKSERHQYNISDLKAKNIEIARSNDNEKEKEVKVDEKVLAAGILMLPPKPHKHKDVYETRPDYPECSANNVEDAFADKLKCVTEAAVEIIESTVEGNMESESQIHSEV